MNKNSCRLNCTHTFWQWQTLGHIPNDPDDGSYICPNDILPGKIIKVYPGRIGNGFEGTFSQTNHASQPPHSAEMSDRLYISLTNFIQAFKTDTE